MAAAAAPPNRRRRVPERTRAAILAAAVREFAQHGLEGARTENIAIAAGVNKALIHYYFRNKQTLYGAVLDSVFSGLAERMRAVLARKLSPQEKLLAYAGAHFDYIASHPVYPRLVQREMMRGPGSPHVRRIVSRYLRPLAEKVTAVLREGMRSGEFRDVHPLHFVISIIALNIFYVGSAPVLGMVMGDDPLRPRRLAERRHAVLDFIAAGLFSGGRQAKPKVRRKEAI